LLFLLDLRAQSGRQRTGGCQAKANEPKDHSNCMLAPPASRGLPKRDSKPAGRARSMQG